MGPDTGATLKTLTIEIPEDEWSDVLSLARMTDVDESQSYGWLLLGCAEGKRSWAVATPNSMTIIEGGPTEANVLAAVSRRLVQFAASCGASADLCLEIDHDDRVTSIWVKCLNDIMRVEPVPTKPNDYFSLVSQLRRTGPNIKVDANKVATLVDAAFDSHALNGSEPTLATIEIDEGALLISASLPDIGLTWCRTTGESSGTGKAVVDLGYLRNLLHFHDATICIHLPNGDGGLVHIKAPKSESFLTPILSNKEQVRRKVEESIEEIYGRIAVYRDHDDDYRLVRRGTPIFARLLDGEPTRLQVFAVLLDEIEESPELFAEINDHNVELGYVRVAHLERQVWAVVDLMAETMNTKDLQSAVERIGVAAERLAPLLQLRFGGQADAAEDARWEAYEGTVVMAEVTPGKYVALNGPDAVQEWPFQGPVYGITAWDPQGVHRSAKENEAANHSLASDILILGLNFVRAYGVGLELHEGEPGFAVWGASRELARQLGTTYEQDAIFEITPDQISVISCFDERVFTKGRFD